MPAGPAKPRIFGVVTGDVVGSTRLSRTRRRRLPVVLMEAGQRLRTSLGPAMPYDLDVFGGDSWQLIVADPRLVLRSALFVRAWVMGRLRVGRGGPDSRAVAAIGRITLLPPAGRVSQADGPALRLSGRGLRELEQGRLLRLFPPPGPGFRGWESAVDLLDAMLLRQLTPARALPLAGALLGLTQSQTARLPPGAPVRQSTVNRALRRLSWPAISAFLHRFEATKT